MGPIRPAISWTSCPTRSQALMISSRPFCSAKTATAGGVLGFTGIACPVCNKVLLLLFGGELLRTYFEPLRIYFAGAGVLLAAVAVAYERSRVRRQMAEVAAQSLRHR